MIDQGPPPTSEFRSITRDLLCQQCDYNLRGLAISSNCPECGTAVISSLRSRRMRDISKAFAAIASSYGWSVIFGFMSFILLPLVRSVTLRGLRALCNTSRLQPAHRLIVLSMRLSIAQLAAMALAVPAIAFAIAASAPQWSLIGTALLMLVIVVEALQFVLVLRIAQRFARAIDHEAHAAKLRATMILTTAFSLLALGIEVAATCLTKQAPPNAGCFFFPALCINFLLTWLAMRDLSISYEAEPEESVALMTKG